MEILKNKNLQKFAEFMLKGRLYTIFLKWFIILGISSIFLDMLSGEEFSKCIIVSLGISLISGIFGTLVSKALKNDMQ